METIKSLKEGGGKARHGKSERYTQPDMRALLKCLDGDKKVVEVLTWIRTLSVSA